MSRILELTLKILAAVFSAVLGVFLFVGLMVGFENGLRPDGFFARLFGADVARPEVAVALAVLGLAAFALALRATESNFRFASAVKLELYRLANDIHFVRKLNSEVMTELRKKAEKDSTIEIYEGDERPAYEQTLEGERDSREGREK